MVANSPLSQKRFLLCSRPKAPARLKARVSLWLLPSSINQPNHLAVIVEWQGRYKPVFLALFVDLPV